MSHPAWTAGARTGPVRRHKQLVFFACEGLIALYDERKPEEDYVILRPAEFDERARALSDFAKKFKSDPTPWQRQESNEMLRAAQDMTETAKEARYMGDPSDPAVQAFWAKHRRVSRVAFNSSPTEPPSLEEMAAAAKGTKQAPGVPDMTNADLMKLRRKPTRKPRSPKQIVLTDDLL